MGENKITRLCKSLPFLDENQMLAPYAMLHYANLLGHNGDLVGKEEVCRLANLIYINELAQMLGKTVAKDVGTTKANLWTLEQGGLNLDYERSKKYWITTDWILMMWRFLSRHWINGRIL
ncbi:MAG: hypothetical protein ACPGSN_10135 [Psychrobium sp.]